MTNLLEKALLTAFGIFILITFISIILPFWDQIINYKGDLENDYNLYSNIINEFDQGILFVIENPDEIYQKNIDYPDKLNVTLDTFYIKYEFIMNNELSYILSQYDEQFSHTEFKNLQPQIYRLKILYQLDLIEVHLF